MKWTPVVPTTDKKRNYLYTSLYINYMLSFHHIKLESRSLPRMKSYLFSLRQAPFLFSGVPHLEIGDWQDVFQKTLGALAYQIILTKCQKGREEGKQELSLLQHCKRVLKFRGMQMLRLVTGARGAQLVFLQGNALLISETVYSMISFSWWSGFCNCLCSGVFHQL